MYPDPKPNPPFPAGFGWAHVGSNLVKLVPASALAVYRVAELLPVPRDTLGLPARPEWVLSRGCPKLRPAPQRGGATPMANVPSVGRSLHRADNGKETQCGPDSRE